MPGYPCPCCGRLVHDQPPGSYLICPVCGWEDDLIQLRWPHRTRGANRSSLVEAQYSQEVKSACNFCLGVKGCDPDRCWPSDPGFRFIDLDVDNFESLETVENEWPKDRTRLYWWRRTFWRGSQP
ncbi:CPCC family cysteine-rich protein [Actinopolyspora lacussalsi]|uniref:CPCC family cysteine-rich protein n=1 Tax=Actinopolyspora righensis TaxID=995060 RepID=UPI000B86180A